MQRIAAPGHVAVARWLTDGRVVATCAGGALATLGLDGRSDAIDVGPSPRALHVTADGFAIVGDGDAPFVSIVDLGRREAARVRAAQTARTLAVGGDEQWLVTSSGLGGSVTLWDTAALAELGGVGGADHVNDLAIVAARPLPGDRRRLEAVTLLDLCSGDVAATLPGQRGAAAVAFTPDGALVTVFGGELSRWDVAHEWAFAAEAEREVRAWIDRGACGRIWPDVPGSAFELDRILRVRATLARLGGAAALGDELAARAGAPAAGGGWMSPARRAPDQYA